MATVAALALGFADEAQATDRPKVATLAWDAPAGCPTTDAVLERLERTLVGAGQVSMPFAAAAHVTETTGQPWRVSLVLHVHGTRTERQFEAESCDAIAAATVLIIALAAEDEAERAVPPPVPPSGHAEAPKPNPTPAVATVNPTPAVAVGNPAPAVAAAPPPAPAATARSWRRSQHFVLATGILDWGTLESPPAAGFEVLTGRRWTAKRWRLSALAGISFFPNHGITHSYIGPEGDLGHLWLLNLSARGCVTVAFSRFEVGPCVGAELATMHASGTRGFPGMVATSTQSWFSPVGSAVASWNVFRTLDLVLRTDLVIPTTRRSVSTEPVSGTEYGAEIYRVPAVAWRGALGLNLRFW